jgi:hypothetical protein
MKIPKEKRGPSVTAQMVLRVPSNLRGVIVKWAENQFDRPSLSEATRRLIELGLTVKSRPKQTFRTRADRAHAMAGDQLDQLADDSATAQERANRKRRLLRGPEEFQDVRVDRTVTKK